MIGKRGRNPKEFEEYLVDPTKSSLPRVSLDEYVESPAVGILRYCVQAHYAMLYCIEHFPETSTGISRIAVLSSGLLPSIMGHFETFQKHLFSGVFEYSVYIKNFDVKKFFQTLKRNHNLEIDPSIIAAYRGMGVTSGIVLAENLTGWHNPDTVNAYFTALLNVKPFDEAAAKRLKVLWQLRHSIVHTGGSITMPDAQKVQELLPFAGKEIVFENNFISEVSRKLHPIVSNATISVRKSFFGQLAFDTPKTTKQRLDKFFLVKSSISAWLPKEKAS